ncbi:PREDICTED: tRNA (guanine(10)-N2)-methyltransferase homolog isoform X1 [Rhagoletis zephyria]|uniref:tRNA (guanine(10)-N2)-methyltransferase homolog isoform X1 n=1 Tax=Rhagoletis zephyria TaxID=28612 RepID=UPI00081199E5|nr:PREDICTED: tRNA (guanine(10)-N2)-methyltransferase homolog isoform X1 [Rhagoletis zephyria]XP_017480649.1 PREDICTED: tRNA (guanine(10)-N2)-methyltransferase homolog isoform X1 [Rhagoletis zephyria]
MTNRWKKYILWFAQEHLDFRVAEFNSILKLFGLKHKKLDINLMKPFWIVEFPNDEEVMKLASRSVSLRSVYELWSHSKHLGSFHEKLGNFIANNEDLVEPYTKSTFKIVVETYNKHISQKEKVEKIETLDYLPLHGAVDLKAPQNEWCYIEFYGLDPSAVSPEPEDVLFGRLIANGQRELIKELSLKKRKFIGNTSMDAQLSLLMANQALVKDYDLVLDPFVGTGSLLAPFMIHFIGYVLGTDIDFMMLHGRSRPSRITQKVREKDERVRSNLEQYGCGDRYLDVIISDFSKPLWREDIKLDAIITDPPYGIREATEKVETKKTSKQNTRIKDMPHYPSTSHYALKHLYHDLLNFSAQHLKVGGRLVCWLPYHREDYNHDMIPQHGSLMLVANSEQPLSGLTSRRLLTYEKLDVLYTKEVAQPACTFPISLDFRDRYFNNGLESRTERRLRKAEQRELGRIEALKRGKAVIDSKELKINLNKSCFT